MLLEYLVQIHYWIQIKIKGQGQCGSFTLILILLFMYNVWGGYFQKVKGQVWRDIDINCNLTNFSLLFWISFFLFEQAIKPLIFIPSVSFVHSQPFIVHLYQKFNKDSINQQPNLSSQKGNNCFTVNLATVCLSAPWETTSSGSGRSVLHSGRKCSLLIKTSKIIFFHNQQKWELLIKCLVIGEALHQMLSDWVSLDSDYMHRVFHFVKLWILTGGSM